MKLSNVGDFVKQWFFPSSFFLLAFLLSGCGAKNPGLTSAKIYLNLIPPDYDKATEQLQIALKADSLNGEAHFLLGKIYAGKDMYPEMLSQFDKAEKSRLKPKDSKIIDEIHQIKKQKWTEVLNSAIRLGRSRQQISQYKLDLLTDFSKYSGYKDSLKAISTDLGVADRFAWDSYQMFSQTKPAIEELEGVVDQETARRYQTAILIDSTRYEAFLNLAVEYVRRDESNQALEYYRKAYQLKPDDPKVMNDYAIVLLSTSNYEEAENLYEKTLEKDSTNVNALVNLAMIYAKKGDNEKALSTYSRIISIDPEYKDAYFNRGLLLLARTQEKASVVKSQKDSLAKKPKDKELLSQYQSAWTDYSQMLARAEADFQRTVQIDSTDKDAYFHLGLLYLSRAQLSDAGKSQDEDYGRAEGFFKKSVGLDSQDIEALKYLGFTLLSEKKWEEATSHLEKSVELVPTDREAWGYLAIAYARLGQKDKAEAAFKKSGR
ncbi:MAG: tetratricopeptide repeat protein [Candidatus Zixiibacteriota bacterium]